MLGPGPEQTIRRIDTLAVEEPLEIRLNGESYLVTMRTPGNDIDLVHGLLYSESIIAERSDVVLARYCAGSGPDGVNTYNVLDVTLATSCPPASTAARRNVLTTQRVRDLRHHHDRGGYARIARTRGSPGQMCRLR